MNRRSLGTVLVVLGTAGLALVALVWAASGVGGTILQWFWLILMPALLLLSGLSMRREEAERTTTPVAIPERDDDDEWTPVTVTGVPEGPVTACMRCGSLRMQPAPLGADALFNQYRCARCGFRGQPLHFESGDAYAAFVRGLHAGGPN